MVAFKYNGKRGRRITLSEARDLVVVRTRKHQSLESLPLRQPAREVAGRLEPVESYPAAGVAVYRGRAGDAETARSVIRGEADVRFAGRVLRDTRSRTPVLYTENFFIKFEDGVRERECRSILRRFGLSVKRALGYAPNSFFIEAKEGTGRRIFDISLELLEEDAVALCHPELVRQMNLRGAFPMQWHLKRTSIGGNAVNAHANVEAAWSESEGEGTTIAVIDDGIDMVHEEFFGAGKIVFPRDVTRANDNPVPGASDNHGTACAGVACAGGLHGASGVAPKAALMPIRLASGLGSQAEADAFVWAADHGADVISCSWGPRDGNWWDPNDPTHNQVVPLPDSTRLAIDYAIRHGRNGKGCVITWAAGNGNESVENDGYASYDKVIAVAACNDKSEKSAYSDFGASVWCAFPSNHGMPSLTPGIWTTDRSGPQGYNAGNAADGDAAGDYTDSFGGTSSACPGAAGVAALVLSRNPGLRWDEVKGILRDSCDKIDRANGNYDAATGHSPLYGHGRLNAKKAVSLAAPQQTSRIVLHGVRQDVAIADLQQSTLSVAVADDRPLTNVRLSVDIEHTYIGDLVVRLTGPSGDSVTVHDRAGGGTDNLNTVYDTSNSPGLSALLGQSPQGTWTLSVSDRARQDTGLVRGFTLELGQ